METYAPRPLIEHECLTEKFEQQYSIEINLEIRKQIGNLLIVENPTSALYKHKYGRHVPLELPVPIYVDKQLINILLSSEASTSMIELYKFSPLKPNNICCGDFLDSLVVDYEAVCLDTFFNKRVWKNHRQFRITGSRCYGLFTYTQNKTADWEKKSLDYFYPKPFHINKAMKHGLTCEASARLMYEMSEKVKVTQFGLIVSKLNPWLAYSPDRVVFDDNGNPCKLIEIKCPFTGRDKPIADILSSLDFLDMNNHLKPKHKYYGQTQLGMAILNLKETDFIVYASFNKSLIVITVPYDKPYTDKMLSALKRVYFNNMLHYICIKQNTTS